MADDQVLHSGRSAGGGILGDGAGGLVGPVFVFDAIGGAFGPAGSELPDQHELEGAGRERLGSGAVWRWSAARDPERDDSQFEAAALSAGVSTRAAVHLYGIAEFLGEPVLLPGDLSVGRAAGIGFAVVDSGPGKE